MSNAELIATLRRHRLMASTEDAMQFDRAVQRIAEQPRESDLPHLLRVFDDRTEHMEVMWMLVHLVEEYDAVAYANAFVDLLPETLPIAREWMEILAMGQLNHDEARGLMFDAVRHAEPAARDAVADALRHIAARDDAVAVRSREAMVELGLA